MDDQGRSTGGVEGQADDCGVGLKSETRAGSVCLPGVDGTVTSSGIRRSLGLVGPWDWSDPWDPDATRPLRAHTNTKSNGVL